MPSSISRTDTATNVAERIDYAYDGNLVTGETISGTVNGSLAWTYDSDFAVKSLSVNGGAAINFTYDNDKALTVAGAETLTRNTTNSLLTGTTLGTVSDSYTYDTFGAPSRYTAKAGGASIFDVQYTRDGLGRISRKVETIGGVATTYDYVYDLAGRLTGVKENGVTVSTYEYDQNGNRLSAVTKLGSFTGTYDDQDRMLTYGGASYTYTANGELKTKTGADGVTTFDYDVFGNLTKVVMPNGDIIEYVIDAKNRRVGKKVNGALVQGFIYKDQLEPVAELDGAGNVVSTFIYASKRHVPDYMVKGGVTYRIISDHLGAVRMVINTSDNSIAQRMDYDEFGNITQDTNPSFQPFAYVGGVYDNINGLTRLGARDYYSIISRWNVKDPIDIKGGVNLYSYTASNPINMYDISGLHEVDITSPESVSKRNNCEDNCFAAREHCIMKAGAWGVVGIAGSAYEGPIGPISCIVAGGAFFDSITDCESTYRTCMEGCKKEFPTICDKDIPICKHPVENPNTKTYKIKAAANCACAWKVSGGRGYYTPK